jgi:hypothetical protein
MKGQVGLEGVGLGIMKERELGEKLVYATKAGNWREAWELVNRWADLGMTADIEVQSTGRFAYYATGATPLHFVSHSGDSEFARSRVGAGASTEAMDEHGSTPLHVTSMIGNDGAAKVLLAWGANKNVRNAWRQSPLRLAAGRHHVDVVNTLLAAGADTGARDHNGWSPLHHAALRGWTDMIELFLAAGANRETTTRDGRTPRFLAWSAETKKLL